MNNNKISVYGGTGFIGGNFCKLFERDVVAIPREQRNPESKQILIKLKNSIIN